MTTVVAFDSHRFVKNLMQNGFSLKQAEVLAEEQTTLLNENLATKVDIEKVRAEIEALRQATKAEIQKIQAEIDHAKWSMVKWMLGAVFSAMIGLAGLIIALA